MNENQRPFPCGDLLTEARLEGQELIHDLSRIVKSLELAALAIDYDEDKQEACDRANDSKEAICIMINSLMKIRDEITFWQALASDNSPLN